MDNTTKTTVSSGNTSPSYAKSRCYLPAEWHPQTCVQLTWPTAQTDWADTLDEVVVCYRQMVTLISRYEQVILLAHNPSAVAATLDASVRDHVTLLACPYNDTWVRDYAALTCIDNGHPVLHHFRFNGWGGKFPADLDNNTHHHIRPFLKGYYQKATGVMAFATKDEEDFVLEGGSIDTNGKGTLIATTSCLLHPNRNPHLTPAQIEKQLLQSLHCQRILWLHHGQLEGDDTDGHVDTLARFCPDDTIAYTQCQDPEDTHFEELNAMEKELQAFRTTDGKPYRLLPLPLPRAIFDKQGNRLPATYTNFLILNGAVLLPVYGQPDLDALAEKQLQQAFPDRTILPLDARALIVQRGSVHCATMQYPLVSEE